VPDFSFLRARAAQVTATLLLAQALVFYARARGTEQVPLTRPLAEFPGALDGGWRMIRDAKIDDKVQAVLRADDLLSRGYSADGVPVAVDLFMAYFKSQRYGQKPHSPQNCLPGSGWEPSRIGYLHVKIPGRDEPIQVNRYLVQRGPSKSLVLYWYQSRDRVVASEYKAQVWSVVDAIRLNRSDTSIVRIVIPVERISDSEAEGIAVRFAQSVFPHLEKYFPA
jgi:EpsI family protein